MNDQPASRQFHDGIRIGRRRRGAGSPGRVAHPGLDELDFLGNALRRRRAVDGLGLRQLLHAADQVIAAPEDSDVALGSPGLDDRVGSCPATNQQSWKDHSGAVAGSISSQELPCQLNRRCNTRTRSLIAWPTHLPKPATWSRRFPATVRAAKLGMEVLVRRGFWLANREPRPATFLPNPCFLG